MKKGLENIVAGVAVVLGIAFLIGLIALGWYVKLKFLRWGLGL